MLSARHEPAVLVERQHVTPIVDAGHAVDVSVLRREQLVGHVFFQPSLFRVLWPVVPQHVFCYVPLVISFLFPPFFRSFLPFFVFFVTPFFLTNASVIMSSPSLSSVNTDRNISSVMHSSNFSCSDFSSVDLMLFFRITVVTGIGSLSAEVGGIVTIAVIIVFIVGSSTFSLQSSSSSSSTTTATTSLSSSLPLTSSDNLHRIRFLPLRGSLHHYFITVNIYIIIYSIVVVVDGCIGCAVNSSCHFQAFP
ncbi:hypothetical protein AGLY_010403 [Aphis glycines]|uniref:Uncharacterized protein n=1 Tax=Aphis glycines TaxID=307491 RepID=A0A6G0TFL3_APHGL|nr:hypothetical protein AGLY_010403 [Aphis glycines]